MLYIVILGIFTSRFLYFSINQSPEISGGLNLFQKTVLKNESKGLTSFLLI